MRISEKSGVWALYERLSRDDDQQGDSNSIVNQKRLLEKYALDNGVTNFRHYTDDGYSGANFERPAWKRMIEDVEAGQIAVVVAKDMSRIGRNYLEVGYMTEIFLPQKKVRFIAINNNVDSNVQGSNDFTPFLNIMNEHMVKETSRKIKAVMQMKGKEGKHLSGNVIYGYKADPADRNHWLIDEESANIVRRIFQLCIEGHGVYQIAGILTADKVETPAYYLAKRGLGNHKSRLSRIKQYQWSMGTVGLILSRPEYLGHTVSFRTQVESYKTKKQIKNDPSEWVIVENTQEPIVDRETWDLVQKLRQTARRTDTTGEANPLTGLVYCADCGCKMRNRRAKGKKLRSDPSKHGVLDDSYICSTNANSQNAHLNHCTRHTISTHALRSIVLQVIQTASKIAIENEGDFRERILQEHQNSQQETAKTLMKKLEQDKQRSAELDNLIVRLFEANATGKISDKRFKMMSDRYEQELAQLEQAIEQGEADLYQLQCHTDEIDKFVDLAKRYTDFSELTTPMLNHFVDKIIVHEAEKIDGERTQTVDVYLNYIGKFEPPAVELTAEELAQLEREKKRRASATSKLQAKLQERILSVSELASGLEQLRWGLIGMQYKVLFNEEHRSSQQERLTELENLKTAYKLNNLNGKNLYATKKRLERERNALSPLQIFRRQELTQQINDLTVKLQTCIEEKHDLLYQMGCSTEKDLSLVDKRIETLKEAIAQAQSVNAQFHNAIQNDCEQFQKEKTTIPTELLGEVQQERRYLRQEHRYDLLHELQNDRKHYDYERYQQAESFIDRALQDEPIQPVKRPKVVEQERTHHVHRKHQYER